MSVIDGIGWAARVDVGTPEFPEALCRLSTITPTVAITSNAKPTSCQLCFFAGLRGD